MTLPINDLYELTFRLIHLLRIQPSEIDGLTVPESRAYINLYDESKRQEAEAYEKAIANRNNNSNNKNNTIKPNTIRRRTSRRR